jgi:putative DNA primase/helicase
MPDKPNLSELHNKFKNNVLRFPGILKLLSEELGVTIESLQLLEVGFYPKHQSWIFPERDETGKIIGLMERFDNGKKLMLRGSESKRGLTYVLNNQDTGEKYVSGKHNWIRVSKEQPCPLCGKADGCLLPAANPDNPGAIVCVHISKGSVKTLELGHLHILRPQSNYSKGQKTVLIPSESPILVVEGASDVAAGQDLGFTTVGRPSAEGGIPLLRNLLAGRDVVIIGENDSGAGVKGMESAFAALKDICKNVVKVLPPEGVKDLRAWKNQHGLIAEILKDYILKSGNSTSNPDIFEDDVASTIAEAWIKQEKMKNGHILIRNYKQQWVEFTGKCYDQIDMDTLKGQIYSFLSGKNYYHKSLSGDITVQPYKPTSAKIRDIIDAMTNKDFGLWCPPKVVAPIWFTDKPRPAPLDLMTFQNGILDFREYLEGKIVLYDPTPEFFTTYVLPYNFDENAESMIWDKFLGEIFNNDTEKIRLLAQWFGYNCVPDRSYEKLMLFHGRTSSGKSTVLDAFQAMIGERQCSSTSFTTMAGEFGNSLLLGKLSILVGDARSPRKGEAEVVLEKLLSIVSGDKIAINQKFKDIISGRLPCRFTISMNELPAFTDHARALERRLNIITFENSYEGREDFSLKPRLEQDAAAGKLINFALRGLKDLRLSGRFCIPGASKEAFLNYRDIASPTFAFANDCIELVKPPEDPERAWVSKDQLFDLWKLWCINQGRQHGFKESFCRNFLATCPQIIVSRRNMGGLRVYGFAGLRITKEAFKEYFNG